MAYAIFARSETESKTADVRSNLNSPENMAICWSLHFVSSHHSKRNTFYVAFGLEYRINVLRSEYFRLKHCAEVGCRLGSCVAKMARSESMES